MSDFKVRWKTRNHEILIEASKYVVIALLLALGALGGIKSASELNPNGLLDQFSKVINAKGN